MVAVTRLRRHRLLALALGLAGGDELLALRRRGLHLGLRVADLDLGAGGEVRVRSGQVDVEPGDEAVEGLRSARAGARVGALLERGHVTPVGEGDPAVGRGRRGLAEHDQVGDRRAGEAPARRAAERRAVRLAGDRVRGDLAAEERARLRLA